MLKNMSPQRGFCLVHGMFYKRAAPTALETAKRDPADEIRQRAHRITAQDHARGAGAGCLHWG
jgi:hypothetical protein